jgi:hypothetical protein
LKSLVSKILKTPAAVLVHDYDMHISTLYEKYLQTQTGQSVYGWATGWMAGVQLPAGARHFYLLHSIQTSSQVNSAS